MSLLPRLPKISWNVEMFAHSLLDGESQGNKTQCSKLLLRQNIVKTTNPKWPTCHQWTHMTGNPYKRHPVIDPDIVILSSMSNWWTLWSRLCLVGQAGLAYSHQRKKRIPLYRIHMRKISLHSPHFERPLLNSKMQQLHVLQTSDHEETT